MTIVRSVAGILAALWRMIRRDPRVAFGVLPIPQLRDRFAAAAEWDQMVLRIASISAKSLAEVERAVSSLPDISSARVSYQRLCAGEPWDDVFAG